MKPGFYSPHEYLFLNGDDVSNMYFLVSGNAKFVLPRFENKPYIALNPGNHFGLIDIVGSSQKYNFDLNDWYDNKHHLFRQFSCRAFQDCQVFFLTIEDLNKMKGEFMKEFKLIYNSIAKRYEVTKKEKDQAITLCDEGNVDQV